MDFSAKFTIFIAFSLFLRETSSEEKKRILLNDPDMLNSRIDSMQHEMQALKSELQDLKSQHSNQGTHYIRWGRKVCPALNGTSTVYSGIVGGRIFNDKSGGFTTLCLPHNPDPASKDLPTFSYSARVYGAEYELTYKGIADNDDVPCAVCFSTRASSTFMIPAKTTCPPKWTKQYEGFLTADADYSDHYGSEFLCMDENPEYLTEGARQHNNDGRLFYTVQAVCGSLPCPPYTNAQLMTCVVCSL
ncbi:short-chain collagen C4-like [Ostrea edulis]|uniref:short-chain collagen C4-like n=1 Tax=Ostrea edulis TaxID=37623 RepID=UPI0024AF162F|nr:short-chain collagen C4-like [Ostrea edulis]